MYHVTVDSEQRTSEKYFERLGNAKRYQREVYQEFLRQDEHGAVTVYDKDSEVVSEFTHQRED
jgi:uncharacterized phage-like protein YoqJ